MPQSAEVLPFFSTGSPYLSHPLLTPERTAAEVDEIERLVGTASFDEVLDVGCGFGRHSIEFAARGAKVTGFDPSPTMIDAAQRKASQTTASPVGQQLDFVCHAAADLNEVDRYDLAVCLFTTFGQQGGDAGAVAPAADDGPHVELLRSTYRALRPGGHMIIELPDRERAVAGLVEHEELGPTVVTRSFDAATSTMHERFEPQGSNVYVLQYRLFAPNELIGLVEEVGFEVLQTTSTGLVEPPFTLSTFVLQRPT